MKLKSIITGADVKFIVPCKALKPYVRYYWTLKNNEPFSILTFPTGCPQIIFHRRKPLFIPELSNLQNKFTISGQVNFPAHIASVGNTEMVVAVFYPHTIGLFIDTPPSAFYNQEVSGYDIENRQLSQLADQIFDCPDSEPAISFIEQWLTSRIKPSLNINRIGATLSAMLFNPSTQIGRLAEIACLGKKQFERVFRECVGMNPKEYGRIVRFQRALQMMQLGFRDYADIAYATGYSDQSHFIREFRQFSSLTPKQLIEYQAPYSDLFTPPQLSEY